MDEQLRERREETWEFIVQQGRSPMETARLLSRKYDSSQDAIRKDIYRMEDWLPKLDEGNFHAGISRLRELRKNRQQFYRIADEADQRGDPESEIEARKNVDKSLERDIKLAQSLGLTENKSMTLDDVLSQLKEEDS